MSDRGIVDALVEEALQHYRDRFDRQILDVLTAPPVEDPFEVKWHAPIVMKPAPFIISKKDWPFTP